MTPGLSDHSPLVIRSDLETNQGGMPFKIFNHMADHKEFELTTASDIAGEIRKIYTSLVGSTDPTLKGVDLAIVRKGPTITDDAAISLIQLVTTQEIDAALSGIDVSKAPGLDVVTLVPKIKNSSRITEVRPIACCYVVYKIIAKILTARMQPIVGNIINGSKAGFIPGRSIADNILLASELIKGYNRKYISPRCMIKILFKESV
ncbi:uncharacterized protein [Spinacia oleracea]|uniref:Reverse transcriptase domain-containing protein n=1 Tax=Spinacia oleracea TaxID=3562 RepID=A0ABM3RS58_SPIOL|nr:uncharacterized protein LOC130472063 [Spinacia oleracea]